MQYLLLIYGNESQRGKLGGAERKKTLQEFGAFTQSINSTGHYRGGNELDTTSKAAHREIWRGVSISGRMRPRLIAGRCRLSPTSGNAAFLPAAWPKLSRNRVRLAEPSSCCHDVQVRVSFSSLRRPRPAPVSRHSLIGDERSQKPTRTTDTPARGHSGHPRHA
jgi:hypothetical protein